MGQGDVRKLMVGHEMVMLYVHRKKGLIDPVHRHDDHETIACPISEALEDCEQLEIKSPLR